MQTHYLQNQSPPGEYLKLGVALSGGGFRGVAHVGALKAFKHAGIEIDMITGTSAGALIAALFAFGVPFEKMLNQSKEFRWMSRSSLNFSKSGLLSNKVVGKVILNHIGNVNIEDAPIPLAIVATDIKTGEKVVLRQGNLEKAVMASSCIPGVFEPVAFDGRLLVDGCLVENLPVTPLRKMGADIVVGVNLNHGSYREPASMFDVFLNAWEISIDAITKSIKKNVDILIVPNFSTHSEKDSRCVQKLAKAGYTAACKAILEIHKSIKMKRVNHLNNSLFKLQTG